jgi:hypothetical protein
MSCVLKGKAALFRSMLVTAFSINGLDPLLQQGDVVYTCKTAGAVISTFIFSCLSGALWGLLEFNCPSGAYFMMSVFNSGFFYGMLAFSLWHSITPTNLHLFTSEEMSSYAWYSCECVICLEEVQWGEDLKMLYCQHVFHRSCIDMWQRENLTCPTCRQVVAIA